MNGDNLNRFPEKIDMNWKNDSHQVRNDFKRDGYVVLRGFFSPQGISDFGTPEDQKLDTAIHAQPGEMLIHHCMPIHRADPNRSDRTRRAIGIVYHLASAKEDKKGVEEYEKQLMAELAQSGKI